MKRYDSSGLEMDWSEGECQGQVAIFQLENLAAPELQVVFCCCHLLPESTVMIKFRILQKSSPLDSSGRQSPPQLSFVDFLIIQDTALHQRLTASSSCVLQMALH